VVSRDRSRCVTVAAPLFAGLFRPRVQASGCTTGLYTGSMSSNRSMITIATDPETKERVRRYAEAAGVDLSTYVSVAIHAAMRRDDEVARTFAPLDAAIEEAEARTPPEAVQEAVTPEESASIARALDNFFSAPGGQRNVA
jgi:hypothetical protein